MLKAGKCSSIEKDELGVCINGSNTSMMQRLLQTRKRVNYNNTMKEHWPLVKVLSQEQFASTIPI